MGKLIDLNLLSIFKKNCDSENQDKYQDKLTFDDVPTAGSDNPVKSGGIKTAINEVDSRIAREINDLTLWSEAWAESIQSASDLSRSQVAEALGISEDDYMSLLNGGYLSFVCKSPWYNDGTGDFIYNHLAVTKVTVKLKYGMPKVTVVLGNNDIVITYDVDSQYSNITVNS